MDRTVAHDHVEAAGMTAVDVREPALLRQAETVADVLVGTRHGWRNSQLAPSTLARSGRVLVGPRLLRCSRSGHAQAVGAADVVGRHERGEGRVRAGPVRLDVGEDALTLRRIYRLSCSPRGGSCCSGHPGCCSESWSVFHENLWWFHSRCPPSGRGGNGRTREHHAHLLADALHRAGESIGRDPAGAIEFWHSVPADRSALIQAMGTAGNREKPPLTT